MNMTFAINVNNYPNSIRFKQALVTRQSLNFMCSYKFSYKRRNSWLKCPDVSAMY